MKKKQIYVLLAATVLMATSITGCSNKVTEETAVEETAETDVEEVPEEEPEVVEEPVYETRQYTVEVASQNEDGAFTAYDVDGKEYLLTFTDELSDEEKALVVPEACLIVSTEVQVDTQTAENEEVPATEEETMVTVTAVEALNDEIKAATLATVTFKAINGFSVEDLADTTMYAKQSVNVRKGPSADYEQLGSLSSGQEVIVTGIADSGWYRINYNDETGYCSNNYLQTEKPAPKAVASSNSGSSNDGSAAASETQVAQADTGASASAASGRDFRAEYDAAMRAGDIQGALDIMAEYDGYARSSMPSDGASSSGSSSSGSSSSSSEERSVSASKDFIDYLNQKRAEAGLGQLSWSDSMASTAVERASEIADDFSHSGARNCNGEIILYRNSDSVSEWYDQFYDSPGHRMNMMGDLWGSAAAAYCKVGNRYYVVAMFDF